MLQNESDRFWQKIACLALCGIPGTLSVGSFTSHNALSLRQGGHMRDLREIPKLSLISVGYIRVHEDLLGDGK